MLIRPLSLALLIFAIMVAAPQLVFAGRVIKLIGDRTATDEDVIELLLAEPEAIKERVAHGELRRFQYIDVLEAAASAGRWKVVLWIVRNHDQQYINRPLVSANKLTLLAHLISQRVNFDVVDQILELCPRARPFSSWDSAYVWDAEESVYLLAAAHFLNWNLFRHWLTRFVTPAIPAMRIVGRNGRLSARRPTIIYYLVTNAQHQLFTEVLRRHLLEDDRVEGRLLGLIDHPELPSAFQRAILLELMRRSPDRFFAETDWMRGHTIVAEVQELFAAANVVADGEDGRELALRYIMADQELALFGEEFIGAALDAFFAHRANMPQRNETAHAGTLVDIAAYGLVGALVDI